MLEDEKALKGLFYKGKRTIRMSDKVVPVHP